MILIDFTNKQNTVNFNVFEIVIMGNWQENPVKDELDYYITIEDPHIGMCEIYTSNKFPKCFIVKLIKSLSDVEPFEMFSHIENQQNVYLLGLYGYQIGKNCKCEAGELLNISVTSFWEYLAFSLHDIIEHRRRIQLQFHQTQLWHIVKACLMGYSAFLRNRVYYDFAPSKLMVNHDGRIRLSWMHLQPKNMHLNYYRAFQGEPKGHPEQYFSPQQLRRIQQRQFTHKINFEQANVFSLGMTLLHCSLLCSPVPILYSEKINYNNLNKIICQQLEHKYSRDFLLMMGSMLHEDPLRRATFQSTFMRYSTFMKGQYHILMMKDNKFHRHKKHSINRIRN